MSMAEITVYDAPTGIYAIARHYYLLFQHQTTAELSRSMNGLWGPPGTFSFLRQVCLNPKTFP